MKNNLIFDKLESVQESIKKNQHKARINKIRFAFIAVFSLIFGIVYILPDLNRLDISIPLQSVIIFGLILLLLVFIIQTPLNHFLSDRYKTIINIDLKQTFVLHELSKYNAQMRFDSSEGLSQELLFKNGVFSSMFKGAYSDDLLSGEINSHKVQIAEYHVSSLLKCYFDGFVTLIFHTNLDDFHYDKLHKKKNQNIPVNLVEYFQQNPHILFAKSINGNVLIGTQGRKNMFEYNYSKMKDNLDSYTLDVSFFMKTLLSIDKLTQT